MAYWLRSAVEILLAVQASTSVGGIVRDAERGEPLPGAVVELSDLERSSVTDSAGRYRFQDVPAGPQHIRVRMMGFASRTLHALVPREGRLDINIDLQPDPIPVAGVETRLTLPVRGLDTADSTAFPDRGLTAAAVRNHPLISEPDFFQAVAGGEVVVRPESPGGIHVRGGASDQVSYLLDGIPVFSPYHVAGTFSAWNPDALARLQLSTAAGTALFPDALSGVVSAETRAPGRRLGARGSVSTTQARFTVDGPLGSGGAGYLIGVRHGFSGFIFPEDEPSYLHAEIGDWLAKLELPLLGGRGRLLVYDSENEIDAAAVAEGAIADVVDPNPTRNEFAWQSRSIGGEWLRELGEARLLLRGWRAAGDAAASWRGEAGLERLTAEHRDAGVVTALEFGGERPSTVAGLRVQNMRSLYEVGDSSSADDRFALREQATVFAPFLVRRVPVGARVELEAAAALPVLDGQANLSPRARLHVRASGSLDLSASYSRIYQFVQSLRNAESMVGHIFPVDMLVTAGGSTTPVARNDQVIIGLEHRPLAGVRLGGQAYARELDGLALVAPVTAGPYATSGFLRGSGRVRGLSLDAAFSTKRYGAVAAYGFQDTRFAYGDTSYVPDHGSAHLISAGVIAFPSATFSIRFGVTGELGRRTTRLVSPVEWEACNVLDRGCEFAGSPQDRDEPLGASSLPTYLRVDLGFRKHWHLGMAGRDGLLGIFGTITNVLGRRNVVALASEPETGAPVQIEMRPRAPLVVGVDWRF